MFHSKLLCAIALSAGAVGQVVADEPIEFAAAESGAIDTIIVEADPFGRSADEMLQPVDVISGDELDQKRRGSIGEVLENEPGISTSDFGPAVGRPIIRGQSGGRVSVLYNGVGAMDVSVLSSDHAVTIDPAHAEVVEIIKGPAALLYGSGASAGVVNLVDDRMARELIDGARVEGEVSYGDNADELGSHAHLRYGVGKFVFGADYAGRNADDFEIPGAAETEHAHEEHEHEEEGHEEEGHEQASGVLENSDLRTESYGVNAAWIGEHSTLNAALTMYDSNYGVPGHAHGHEEEEGEHEGEEHEEEAHEHGEAGGVRIDMEQTRLDLRGQWLTPFSGFEKAEVRLGVNDYEHVEIEPSGEPGTVFENDELETRVELVHEPIAAWRGVLGTQIISRDFSAVGEEAFVPPVETLSAGLFLVEERPMSWGRLEAGLRVEQVDHQPDNGGVDADFTPISASAGVIVDLGELHHLRFNFTRAQRAPNAEELYADGPHLATSTFERGNLELDEETANNIEIGVDRHGPRWRWSANVYFNRIDDFVFLQNADENLDGMADRVDEEGELLLEESEEALFLVDATQADAEFYGFELETVYRLLDGPVKLDGRLFADSVRGELVDGGNLPRITPARFGGGLDVAIGAVSGAISLTRVQQQDRLAQLETETEGFELLSAYLSWQPQLANQWDTRFFLQGRNLLDEEARRHSSFVKDIAPLPGVSVIAGVKLSFG